MSSIPEKATDEIESVNQDSSTSPQVPLKQKRLLSDDTHAYEHFELPASRTTSIDNNVQKAPESLSNTSSEDAAQTQKLPTCDPPIVVSQPPNSHQSERPSAVFLNAAGDNFSNSSSENSSPNTSRTTSENTSHRESPAKKFTIGTGSNDSTPAHSRDSSPARRPGMGSRNQSSSSVTSHSATPSKEASKEKHKSRFSLAKSLKKATHWDLGHSSSHKDTHRPASHFNPLVNNNVTTSGAVHHGFYTSDSLHASPIHTSSSLFSKHKSEYDTDTTSPSPSKNSKSHGSMLELKRFFKGGKPKKDHHHSSTNLSAMRSGNRTHSRTEFNQNIVGGGMLSRDGSSVSLKNMPFAEEGFKKYGKVGRILGSGAGGSVRLMKRTSDDTTFAIKEFRPRHPNESQKEYAKKVTAEFCIGSTLHHPNIIETLDIIQEDGKYYEVMEYCPFDFFAIVMSGKMSKGEIGCTFKQILTGLTYLHKMGLAHRDLKLDNCVVTSEGIVKIIDFGSASIFQYPFETEVVRAKGVVGSDPYLAPEVLTQTSYDPQPTDVWSVAIIYCCMTLRRFPWKVPKLSDPSFKLFSMKPTKEEQDMYYQMSLGNSAALHHHHDHKGHENKDKPEHQTTEKEAKPEGKQKQENKPEEKEVPPKITIKGPWRLLRLLPHESRHIIGRMLEIDPTKRATLKEVFADEWIKKLSMCTLDHGTFVKAGTHNHTFVCEEEAHLEAYKK